MHFLTEVCGIIYDRANLVSIASTFKWTIQTYSGLHTSVITQEIIYASLQLSTSIQDLHTLKHCLCSMNWSFQLMNAVGRWRAEIINQSVKDRLYKCHPFHHPSRVIFLSMRGGGKLCTKRNSTHSTTEAWAFDHTIINHTPHKLKTP